MKLQGYDLRKYDFLDLGSKTGGSIEYCAVRYEKSPNKPARGIGIDINPESVEKSREAGFDAITMDILKLDIKHKFKFVSALDFLEHLPNIGYAEEIIGKMATLAKDFLFIRHPSFDDIEYLESLDLKITWNDWQGHTAMMRTYDYTNIFNRLGLKQYCFVYKRPIWDSSSEFIIPISAPSDRHRYSEEMGKKKEIKFKKPVYSQIDIFVALRPIDFKTWNWITREK